VLITCHIFLKYQQQRRLHHFYEALLSINPIRFDKMLSSLILTSLLAALSLATPVDKRHLTTKVEVYTVWTTVTRNGAVATGKNGGHGRHHSSSAVAEPSAVPTTSDVVVSSSTPEANLPPTEAPSSYEAPASSEVPAPTSEAPAPSSEAPAPTSEAPAPTSEAPAPTFSDSNKGVSASAPAPPPPAASSPPPVSNAPSSYGQKILEQHNVHRANHTNTGPLSWSDALAATALKTANSCVYQHDTYEHFLSFGEAH
jgi:hypothetical protein